MIDDSCILACNESLIKVAENGRSAVFRRPNNKTMRKVIVDGCVQIDGPRADYVVERERCCVVIELKGRNVEHAADQVHATATLWKHQEGRCDQLAGLIVARQYPRSSTSIQLKQQRFSRSFGGPLHVVTANSEYDIDNVLSYKGPHRR